MLLNGHPTQRVPGILNVSIRGRRGREPAAGLARAGVVDRLGLQFGQRRALLCAARLGRDTELAQSSLRFSLGRFSSEQEVDLAIAAVRREVERLRAVAP